jgi:hypothetical protein
LTIELTPPRETHACQGWLTYIACDFSSALARFRRNQFEIFLHACALQKKS